DVLADGLLTSVVRRFLGDDDVVHVALADAGRRDANELRFFGQLLDRPAATVAHAGAKAADQLVDHRSQAAFVRDTAFDAFGHELVAAVAGGGGWNLEFVLEVAIAAAAPHGANRAHAAVLLERAALIQDDFTRALVGAGEQAAHHHGAGADGDGLRDVA